MRYFNPFVIVSSVTFNSYDYIQDEAVDHVLAYVAE